jgi:hypothetical protein
MNNILVKGSEKIRLTLLDNIFLVYIFLYANIFISPLLTLIGIPLWKLFTILAFIFFTFCNSVGLKYQFHKEYLYLILFSIITFSVAAIYYNSLFVLTHNIGYILTLTIFIFFDKKYLGLLVDSSTIFLYILIIGSYIGFAYALSGGQPIYEYEEHRLHYIYLTTSVPANTVLGNIMRPAGIYDEPGALSFFICSICLFRVLHKKNDIVTFVLLILGLITFSLTHLLVLICFILYYIFQYKRKKNTLIFVFLFTIMTVVLLIVFYESFDELLFKRLQFNSQTGTLQGDTRSGHIKEIFKFMNIKNFLWGHELAYTDIRLFTKKYPNTGEVPLTNIFRFGFFSSWYYYIFLIIIFLAGIVRHKYFFIFMAVCFLFFQRPYSDAISYSFYFVLFLSYALGIIKEYVLKNTNYFKPVVEKETDA